MLDIRTCTKLLCVYCRQGFSLTSQVFYSNNCIRFGWLECDCDVYPILEGIVYIKKDNLQLNQKSAQLLKSQRFEDAVCLMLEGNRITKLFLTRLVKILYTRETLLHSNTLLLVIQLLYFLNPSSRKWYKYLLDRSHRITFLLSLANFSFLSQSGASVDIGCGIGHFLKEAHAEFPKYDWYGVDISFNLLYLARRFMLPRDVVLICCDINSGIPMRKRSLQNIFLNDCFAYVQNKLHVIGEFKRLLTINGYAFLSHVHNQHIYNPGQGYGITPKKLNRASYKNGLNCYGISDFELHLQLMRKSQLFFKNLQLENLDINRPAYSYVITKYKQKMLRKTLYPKIYQKFKKTTFNYTEDEYLNSDK